MHVSQRLGWVHGHLCVLWGRPLQLLLHLEVPAVAAAIPAAGAPTAPLRPASTAAVGARRMR